MNESNVADAARLSHLEAENAALRARVAELEPWANAGKAEALYDWVVRSTFNERDWRFVEREVARFALRATAAQARTIAAEFGITLPGEEKQ